MVTLQQAAAEAQAPAQNRSGFAIRSHGVTDRGRRRDRNEDQFLIATLTQALRVRESSVETKGVHCGEPRGHLFVVADGMGGHAAGDQASTLAVRTVEAFVVDSLNWCARLRGDGVALLEEFQKAVQRADDDVVTATREHPELRGMGTTLTLAYLAGEDLFIAHAGDSRCYLLRHGKLHQLTHDHTLVQAMVERGVISQEEAATHQLRHIVANVVGGDEAGVHAELHKLVLERGDRILLCSDGLTTMVADREVAATVHSSRDPEQACRRLVDRANELGGKDNVTVIVVHCD
jgi:protein phosphatase